jgi:hypothetical protein
MFEIIARQRGECGKLSARSDWGVAMGGEPYWYFVKYQPDLDAALQELREREFLAGRYNPVTPSLSFPPDPTSPGPGAQHDSIDAAQEDAAEDGTRSILDIRAVGDEPDFFVAAPLDETVIESLYGTPQPTREMIERNMNFFDDVERGHGVYTLAYKDGKPDEILFAGYSFD